MAQIVETLNTVVSISAITLTVIVFATFYFKNRDLSLPEGNNPTQRKITLIMSAICIGIFFFFKLTSKSGCIFLSFGSFVNSLILSYFLSLVFCFFMGNHLGGFIVMSAIFNGLLTLILLLEHYLLAGIAVVAVIGILWKKYLRRIPLAIRSTFSGVLWPNAIFGLLLAFVFLLFLIVTGATLDFSGSSGGGGYYYYYYY
jgi:hypothetical protein